MPQKETQPIRLDLFDGTEWESFETEVENFWKILQESFEEFRVIFQEGLFEAEAENFSKILQESLEKFRPDFKKNLPSFSGGFLIQQCEHCGCMATDDSGLCRQCGRSPWMTYG